MPVAQETSKGINPEAAQKGERAYRLIGQVRERIASNPISAKEAALALFSEADRVSFELNGASYELRLDFGDYDVLPHQKIYLLSRAKKGDELNTLRLRSNYVGRDDYITFYSGETKLMPTNGFDDVRPPFMEEEAEAQLPKAFPELFGTPQS